MARKTQKLAIIFSLLLFYFHGNTQTVTIGNEAVCQNDTVNIPITINTPTAIGALTITMEYDTNDIAFAGMTNVNSSISSYVSNSVNGEIYLVWYANNINPSIISDTIISFQFIGINAGSTNLTWDTLLNATELADITGNILNTTFVNGSVNILTAPVPTFTTNNTTICDNETAVFTASGGTTYEFYLNGQVIQAASTLATYTTDSLENGDSISVQAFNSIGCGTHATSILMTVNDLPIGQMTGDTSICNGEAILLNFSLSTGNFSADLLNNGNTLTIPNISDGAQVSSTPNDTSDYILQSLTNLATGCTTTGIEDTVTIIVFPLPQINLGNDTAICSDETLILDGGSGLTTYLWSDNSSAQTLTVDSTATYGVTITGSNGCINSDNINVVVNCFTLTGTLNYPNSQNSPLAGAEMILVDETGEAINLPSYGTGNNVTTDLAGNYTFTKVPIGSYYVQPYITIPHGGLEPGVDGLLVLQYFTNIINFDNIRFKAADVNADGAINAVDGLAIEARAVGNTSFFPAGDWTYEYNPVIIAIQDVSHLIKAMCFGDVNGSYVP